MKNVKRGDIYYIKKFNTIGTEQAGGRPFLVVSPNELLKNGHGALCVPLTTQNKKPLPQHTITYCTGTPSTVLCEQMRYIDENLFDDYCGTVNEKEMEAINKCLVEAIGVSNEFETIKQHKKEISEKNIEIIKLKAQKEAYVELLTKHLKAENPKKNQLKTLFSRNKINKEKKAK